LSHDFSLLYFKPLLFLILDRGKKILYIFGREEEKREEKIYSIKSLAKSSGLKRQVVAYIDRDWVSE
jgi:hypothetical protein